MHDLTTLTHPALPGREITVRESAVPIHELSGWRRQNNPTTPVALTKSDDQPGQEIPE